ARAKRTGDDTMPVRRRSVRCVGDVGALLPRRDGRCAEHMFFRGRCQARPYSCEWGKRADSSLVMIGGSRRLAGKGCSWGGLRMSIRRLTLLACLALTFGTVAGGAAQDGAAPAAAVVAGTCAAPGDTVTALRDLSVRDGGEVLVSLTTIDVALADLLGADHA